MTDHAQIEIDWPHANCRVRECGELRDGVEWFALNPPSGSYRGGLNGYVLFANRPLPFHDCDGKVAWIGVHGGVTYYRATSGGGCVYGFDTNHERSGEDPIWDVEWIRGECAALLEGIDAIARGEDPPDRSCLMGLGHFVAVLTEARQIEGGNDD